MAFLLFPSISLLILVLSFYFLLTLLRSRNKKSPPQATGGWPLIGHLLLLSGPEHPHIVLSNMADKYGPIFTMNLGIHRALVVSSAEVAKECFTTNDIIFSNRPKTSSIQHMSYNFAMFGFNPYNSYWRELRKISIQKLLSNHRVARLAHVHEQELRSAMKALYSSCLSSDGKSILSVDMKKWIEKFTLDMIVRFVAGEEVKKEMVQRNGYNEKWHEATKEFFKYMGTVTISDVLPMFKWIDDLAGTNKAFKKAGEKMDYLLQECLDCHKKYKKLSDSDEKSFMGQMLDVAEEVAEEFPWHDTDTIIKATCQTMILGGTDTMLTTLTWALCLLLNNPHILKKAQHELDMNIGRERLVNASDVENLVYIQAIIKETLRLYPPATLVPPREASEDCTVAGYHIPANTRLFVNLWKLHRNPHVWSNAEEFQPERFLKDNYKEIDVRGQHFELLPFGAGRRICPGVSFSLQIMELTLASLLHEFDICTRSDEPVDMTGTFGATYMKATPLMVVVKPRLPPELYI